MNYHLFQLVNDAAGHNDLLDDVSEWSAVWLIYVLAAVAVIPVLLGLRTRGLTGVVRVAASLAVAFGAGQVLATVSTEVPRRPSPWPSRSARFCPGGGG